MPVNHSVMFVREGDVIVTNDLWKAVLCYEVATYHDTAQGLKADLNVVKRLADSTAPLGELQQIEASLLTVEKKIANLQRFVPRTLRRRGWVDAGGMVLKTLFGVAREADLAGLQAVTSELDRKSDSLAHSIEHHVTYIKQLDKSVGINQDAIGNLSSGLRDLAMRTNDTFQEISNKLEWEGKRKQAAAWLRPLEFALTKLEESLASLIQAVQTAVGGRIPVGLVPPPLFS
jgi:CII-binding regulator of phage lambda lysogenization HflD